MNIRSPNRRALRSFLLLLPLLLRVPVSAQNAPGQNAPLFRAETRQVIVDVVVSDHNGHFIPGLKPNDFTVLENGKPQKIAAFTMYAQPASPPEPAASIKLPRNQYTNYAIADPDRPITIVLLDVLNTQVQDQAYAHQQMIEFLKDLPSGQRIALFALGTRLKMVQGFTGDSDTLVAAAKMLLRNISLLMTSEADRQDAEIYYANLEAVATGGRGAGGGSPAALSGVANMIEEALAEEQNYQQIQRMGLTLAALTSLARAVSAYPGRKNLLWLSAEFPIRFGPDFQLFEQADQQFGGSRQTGNHAGELQAQTPPLHETAALLTASQIAVYPIDIRGNISPGTGIDIGSPDMYNNGEEALGKMRDRFARRQSTMEWNDHEAMTDIARETGGKAFFGTNDLKDALEKSTREGASYYTIAYSPENHKWDGKYRKIEVKCAASGAKLTYRRGYYAVPDTFGSPNSKAAEDQIARLFATAMQPEAPTSTMVLLKIQVLLPDATHKTVRIDYAINANDVIFTDTPENSKHVTLDLMAVAWDRNGKDAGHSSDKIDSSVAVNVYQEVMRSYIPAHQELELKPGTYTLRLGVVDRNSRKIGTLDVPLTVMAVQSSR